MLALLQEKYPSAERSATGVDLLGRHALLVGVWLLGIAPAMAQSIDIEEVNDIYNFEEAIPDLTENERQEFQEAFGIYTTATTLFTGLNSASGGRLEFDDDEEESDAELEIYRLPFSYAFGSEDDTYRPVLRGVVGHLTSTGSYLPFSEATTELEAEIPELVDEYPNNPDFIKDQVTSIGGGFGLQARPLRRLTITPSFDLVWTHIRTEFDYNNFVSAAYGAKFDREVFNTSLDAISYVPSLEVGYDIFETDCVRITPSVEYSYMWVRDLWGKSSLADFSVEAGVLRSVIEGQVDTSMSISGLPVGFHPYVIRTDVSGAAVDGLSTSYFYDAGLDVTFDTQSAEWVVSQIRVGGAYIFADGFDGYRFGITADLS